jgi:cysteine desulfurase
MIYLDNNSTTIMPASVKVAMLEWCNRGNPSSSYASAREARAMMREFRKYIGTLCEIDPCCPEDRDVPPGANKHRRQDPSQYKIIFTSGASEANCTALHGVVTAYAEATSGIPHIILSAVEHKSLLDMANSYESRGLATVTLVRPTVSGHVRPEDVEAAILPSTCIICVMHANNETGAINDIRAIGRIAHKHNVPFHCDTVQTFGKFPINPVKNNVDSFCISFHKLHGPPGVGALVIKQQLLLGYNFQPIIFGTQNEGYRGGTENLPGIGAAAAATKYTMAGRAGKNLSVGKIKQFIMKELSSRAPTRSYAEYMGRPKVPQPELEIVYLSGADNYLPNTILLSVVKRSQPLICNGKLKADLEDRGIVVSVGSACNTASASASHVLYAMGADELIRKGTLRISLGDETTLDDAKKFVKEFLMIIQKQL